MQLGSIAAFLLLVCLCSAGFPMGAPAHLILHLGKDDRALIRSQILAAARTVGPDGKLILAYAGPKNRVPKHLQDSQLDFELEALILELPPPVRAQLIRVSSNEAYPWVRDSALGWQKKANGKFTLHGARVGNKAFGKDTPGIYSALGISSVLMACQDGDVDLPTLGEVNAQGGTVVANGEGSCIINSDIEKWGKTARELLKKDLQCSETIEGPPAMSWVQQKHYHGHIDLSALFIGPRVVMIPKLDADCRSTFQTGWQGLKKNLERQGLKVIEVSVAGGCIESTKNGTPIIATYSNAVVLKESILLPEFQGDNEDEILKYKRTNDEARRAIVDLMDAGQIPRKMIVGFPMPKSYVSGGGEVRCATFEVPGRIGTCSQKKLDEAVNLLIKRADEAIKIFKNKKSEEACQKLVETSTLLEFFKDEITRERSLTDAAGNRVALSRIHASEIKSALARLTSFPLRCRITAK